MQLADLHRSLGAHLAPDNIPLQYSNPVQEYTQARESAILLDRSHEGRLLLSGKTRFDLLNRMSTNKTIDLAPNTGIATIFTSATARIIERAEAYHLGETLLLLNNPQRRDSFREYLQRNIFFNDDVQISDHQVVTHQFAVHGQIADTIVSQIAPQASTVPMYSVIQTTLNDLPLILIKRKPLIGSHWAVITSQEDGATLYKALLDIGKPYGLSPAGSLTYNILRIQAGQPAVSELNEDYLPLELGLWDEVSFHKGCYTGQEIIARMDSREKLARVMVSIQLSKFVASPAPITHDNIVIGRLTSSAQAPDGQIFALGVIKATLAHKNTYVKVGETVIDATIQDILGTQPEWVIQKQE